MNDFSNLTFLIPVRIDSKDRIDNLRLITAHLLRYFTTHIVIGEEGPPYQLRGSEALASNNVLLVDLPVSCRDLFWRTHVTNQLVEISQTPFAASLDVDVLFPPQQYLEAYRLLTADLADAVYPFDSPTKRIPRHLHSALLRTGDLSVSECDHLPDSNNEVATGGCFFFDRDKFRRYGMENERIIGWGPEDNERDVRLRRLGARVLRVPGPLFHLEHARGRTSRVDHRLSEANEREFDRIASLEPVALAAEVDRWPWTRKSAQRNSTL